MALGAGGDDGDGGLDVLLDEVHVVPGRLGQLAVLGDAPDVALPAGQGLVHRLGLIQQGGHGEVGGDLSADVVAGAHLDLVQVAQAVDGGEGHLGGALHHAAVLGGNRVEPAHTAGPAGGGAVLAGVAAPLPQLLGLVAEELTDKGPGPHGGGVGLGDGDDVLDGRGGHAAAHGAEAGQGVGGGGHGADAQVGILHGAQLALQQHLFALLQGLVHEGDRVAHIGLQGRPVAHQLVKQGLGIQQGLVVQVLHEHVFQGADVLQLAL